jgi:hypothetical protein
MADKNNPLQSRQPRAGFLKPWMIAVIVIGIAWVIGKVFLTLISSVKQM